MSKGAKNNLGCGVFVLATLALALFVVVKLSGYEESLRPKTNYSVVFPLNIGAMGLKSDSEVRIGGQKVGRVVSVDPVLDAQQAPEKIVVKITVDSRYKLYKDANVVLETPLLGSVSTLNFPSIGNAGAGVLEAGAAIEGRAAPGLLAQAGIDSDKVRMLVDDAGFTMARVKARIDPILGNVEMATTDAKDITGVIKNGITVWSPRITRSIENVESASGKINERIDQAGVLVASVQSLISENRQRIDDALQNVRDLAIKFNNEAYPKITTILNEGTRGVKEAADAVSKVRNLIDEESPEVRLMLANLRLASDQLKLTISEVRRNPWRLLYQPGRKELDRELLYEASRTYSASISDLRAAAASLEAITAAAHGDKPADPKLIADLLSSMQASYGKYKSAEDQFLKKLLESPTEPEKK